MLNARKYAASRPDGEKVTCTVKSVHKEGVAVSVRLGGQVVNGTIPSRCYGVGEARARALEAIRPGDVIEAVVRSYDADTRSCSLVLPGFEDLPRRLPGRARGRNPGEEGPQPRAPRVAQAASEPRQARLMFATERWVRIQTFLQEVGVTIDYLHWRTLDKLGLKREERPLFELTADQEGELTEEAVVRQLDAIARQARAGFVDGEDFPVFASLEGRKTLDEWDEREDGRPPLPSSMRRSGWR